MNFIASDCIGRGYLIGQHEFSLKSPDSARMRGKSAPEGILRCLCNALIEEGCIDSVYKQNLLGVLQKLSLRLF